MARGEPLVTEDSLELMDYQDLRVPKEIVEPLDQVGQRVPEVILDALGNLDFQVQGV